jgi:hypothetical protein
MLVIKRWNETFETADTRKRQRLGWFMNPSGCESAGYIELMSYGQDGIMAFAVFQAICQWSATNRQEVRGRLARSDGSAINVRQLSAFIRMPPDVVQKAIDLLMTPDVGWILSFGSKNIGENEICRSSAGHLPVVAGHLPVNAEVLPTLCKDKDKDKDKDKIEAPASFSASRKFQKPSLGDVLEYAATIEGVIDAEAFMDYYESVGWAVGRKPMKDWQAAVRTWARKNIPPKKKERLPDTSTPEGMAEIRRLFLQGMNEP